MELIQRIEKLLDPVAEDLGLDIVRIRFGGEGKNRVLQIMAERQDETPLSLKECTNLSREASALLDVEDWIDGAYTLEVSSPGMERPLTKPKDFERFAGRPARIEMDDAVDGQKRFKGILTGLSEDEDILLNVEDTGAEVRLPFHGLHRARLVVTEEMILEAQRKAKQRAKAQAEEE